MKVKELIIELLEYDLNSEVVVCVLDSLKLQPYTPASGGLSEVDEDHAGIVWLWGDKQEPNSL